MQQIQHRSSITSECMFFNCRDQDCVNVGIGVIKQLIQDLNLV